MQTSWWAWPALGGLLIGVGLLVRAAIGVIASLPGDQRVRVLDTLRRRVRPLSVAGVVLSWTLVYGLYSMTLPPRIVPAAEGSPSTVSRGGAIPPAAGPNIAVQAPSRAPSGPVPPSGAAQNETQPPIDVGLPPPPEDEVQPPCSVQDTSDTVRQAQVMVEALTGRPLDTDLAILIDALAGCADPATAALSLLGPINTLLNEIGILPDTIGIPTIEPIVLPTVPEAIAAPLRPVVFEVCAEASRQLVVVSALSIFLHLDYNDVVTMFRHVDAVCTAFAPA